MGYFGYEADPAGWSNLFGAGDLNSGANGAIVHSSLPAPFVDNSAGLWTHATFEFVASSAMSPTGIPDVVVFLRALSSDGVNYIDGEAGATTANHTIWQQGPHAAIGLRLKAASPQLAPSPPVDLWMGRFQPALLNRAGVPLPASGNMVRMLRMRQVYSA